MTLGRPEVKVGDHIRLVESWTLVGEVKIDLSGEKYILESDGHSRRYLHQDSRRWEILGPVEPPKHSIVSISDKDGGTENVLVRYTGGWYRPGMAGSYDWELVASWGEVTIIRNGAG